MWGSWCKAVVETIAVILVGGEEQGIHINIQVVRMECKRVNAIQIIKEMDVGGGEVIWLPWLGWGFHVGGEWDPGRGERRITTPCVFSVTI